MALPTVDQLDKLEKQPAHLSGSDQEAAKNLVLDIEHTEVEDDPRKWSVARKVSFCLIYRRSERRFLTYGYAENHTGHDR
jgi:hypothetical protein